MDPNNEEFFTCHRPRVFNLNPEFAKHLAEYIDLEEIKWNEKYWFNTNELAIPSSLMLKINRFKRIIKANIPDIKKAERLYLACILSEFQFIKFGFENRKERILNTNSILDGLTELGKAIEAFNANLYNIASIDIQLRKKGPLLNSTSISELKFSKLTQNVKGAPKLKIKGIELISSIFKILKENQPVFEKLQEREMKFQNQEDRKLKRKNLPIEFRNRFCKVLMHFFKDHYPDLKEKEAFYLSGILLSHLDLMPEIDAKKLDPIEIRERIFDTLRKGLKPQKAKNSSAEI